MSYCQRWQQLVTALLGAISHGDLRQNVESTYILVYMYYMLWLLQLVWLISPARTSSYVGYTKAAPRVDREDGW